MALPSSTVWEVRATGSDANAGGFDVGAGLATNLAATLATGSAPVVTSASYTFQARDVGARLFIRSGTNWTPGFYPIASVSGGAATLSAAVGAAQLYGGATLANTAAGCASTASPTGGTWGIDYSQQDAAGVAFSDLVIGATTTQGTSAANPFGPNFVGNLLRVASGTGFTVQVVAVVSVSGTTATFDRSLGTAASTGGAGNLGGAMATPAAANALAVAANTIWIAYNASPYLQTATINFTTGAQPIATSPAGQVRGYYLTRGDITTASIAAGTVTRPTLKLSTNTGLTVLYGSTNGWWFRGLIVDCNNLAGSTGIRTDSGYSLVADCKVVNFTSNGIFAFTWDGYVQDCEVSGGASGATAGINMSNFSGVVRCNVHDNACTGIIAGNSTSVVDNLVTNNTGSSSDGILASDSIVLGNTVHGNGRHGISNNASAIFASTIRNNLASGHTAVGAKGILYANAAGNASSPMTDGNAFWNNTAHQGNIGDTGAVNPINGVAAYVDARDVFCSVSPYVNAAGGDFTLNGTAGGGASLRGAAVPGTLPGATGQGYRDFGCFQHQDAGGGSTYIINQIINRILIDGDS